MPISRYNYVFANKDSLGRRYNGISEASRILFKRADNQSIDCKVHILEAGERLDTLAGQHYGNSSYWWVIAAASGIGWGLQVPPGTVIRIPTNLNDVIGALI